MILGSFWQRVEWLCDHHVVEILHEPKSRPSRADRAQRLVKEAVEKSGHDNTTALVIEIVKDYRQGASLSARR